MISHLQSSNQRKIFAFKEFFKGLQQSAGRDEHDIPPGLVISLTLKFT